MFKQAARGYHDGQYLVCTNWNAFDDVLDPSINKDAISLDLDLDLESNGYNR